MEYRTRVTEIVRWGDAAVSARFERPPGFQYLPGQYMFITIGSGDAALVRHLSISSSPTDPYLEATKGMTGHPFAEALAGLAPGTEVGIRGPYGGFTYQGEFAKVAFVAGGIGITPLRSMARFVAAKNLPCSMAIVYSARNENSVLFHKEFAGMADQHPDTKFVLTLTRPEPGWTGRSGRIDAGLIRDEIPDWRERIFFTSGPSGMVDAMLGIFRDMGMLSNRIRQEYFPGY